VSWRGPRPAAIVVAADVHDRRSKRIRHEAQAIRRQVAASDDEVHPAEGFAVARVIDGGVSLVRRREQAQGPGTITKWSRIGPLEGESPGQGVSPGVAASAP